MMGRQKRIRALAMCGAAVFACAALSVSDARAQTVEKIAMLKGPDRAKILEAGAKKEGKVTIYASITVNLGLRPLVERFMKTYPGVKVEYWRGNGRQIVQKVLAEKRARNIVGDVLEMGGGLTATVKAGAVVPFYSPHVAEYPKEYSDPKGYWSATRISYFGTAYNTKLVAAADVPKTYEDLLDPKWKGKMTWRSNSEIGALTMLANLIITRGEKGAEDYARKLSRQKVVNYSGSARALVDRVGQGEYAIAMNIFAHHPLISKRKGAPLGVVMIEPIPADISGIQLVKNTSHPHAAMLLIDFILSKEGQEVLQKARYFPAHPQVAPDPSIRQVVPRYIKKKQTTMNPGVLDVVNPKAKKLFRKYFK